MSLSTPNKPTSYLHVASKELKLFFASPIAYLFLGVFVAATLFIFFWVESFFARNIADVRPVFEWMPVLLILLSAALTMRMWSEERRSGTLEHVLTLPVSTWQFVIGKFLACTTLLILALLLTTPIPITVSIIGELDWGPVFSGYLATIALGSAYISIGLFVSSRSDNQIVSLILTVILCSIFYLLGSPVFTTLTGGQSAELLRALGSGSRFESITRGVLDIRDFYFYISIALAFLILNRYSLERDRWAADGNKSNHKRWISASALIVLNVLVFNLVIAPVTALRVDTTKGNIYSISDATRGYLNRLQEPLLIRGYFSTKIHPQLAPLVPQMQDLLKEYSEQNKKRIRVEIINPATNPEAEEEAGSKYGIKPVPFRVEDRYQSAVVNSYFHILIKYGDEYKVLSFQDLIEVRARSENDLDVQLRNPEYDLTNAVKQVLYSYQSGGNLFDSIPSKIKLTAFVSAKEMLPESLAKFSETLQSVLEKTTRESEGKFSFKFVQPEANGGAVAQEIAENYGFQPMASSLFDTNTFYFHLLMENGEMAMQVAIPEDLNEDAMNRALNAGLKRFASGFSKKIGFSAPEANPYAAQMGQPTPASFNALQQSLNQEMTAKPVDLSKGRVEDDVDLLMVMAPENLDDKSLYAIDQFLMQGGSVVMATAPFSTEIGQQSLTAKAHRSNLKDWLAHNGISIEEKLVMDAQHAAFPVPMTRQVGAFAVREYRMLDYPYFIELRNEGLNQENPVTASLPQLTIPWASPIKIDAEANANRKVVRLAESSPNSWLSDSLDINPKMNPDGSPAFNQGKLEGSQLISAAITGRFNSFFTDKKSPLLADIESETPDEDDAEAKQEIISGTIEHSPESARLILISSNAFAEDGVLRMQSSVAGSSYMNPYQFIMNAAEWSLEDEGLLSIRSRGHFNRTLPPMSVEQQSFWEILNYVLGVVVLLAVLVIVFIRKRTKLAAYQNMLSKLAMNNDESDKGVAA